MLSDVADTDPRPPPRPVGGYLGARRRVLVVDDHGAHRDLMTDLLTPLGFDLRVAPDAPTCLHMAATWRPDIFLLDLRLPGMDGRELALRLRDTEAGRAPIIFISANAPEMRLGDQPELGGCLVLPKPLDLQELLKQMAERLNLVWAPDPAPAPNRQLQGGTAETSVLSSAQIATLKDLARSGYVRGLRDLLDQLGREQPHLLPALKPLRELVARYRLDAFHAALDSQG